MRRAQQRILASVAVLMLALPVAMQAYGQKDRSEDRAERRRENVEKDSTSSPGWIESKLTALEERVVGGDAPEYPQVAAVRPTLGGLQSGAGITLGLRFIPYRHRHFISSLAGRVSLRKYWGVEALLGYEYERFVTYGYARYRHMPEEDFYGLQSSRLTPERTNYRLDDAMGGILAGVSPVPRTLAGVHLSYMANWYGPGRDGDFPIVEEVFAPAFAPGFGEDLFYGILGAWLEYDARDLPYDPVYGRRFAPTRRRLSLISLAPTSGFYVTAEARRYVPLYDAAYAFNELNVESEQFIPLWHDRHVLAFREVMILTDADDGDQVPFYLMPALGGSRMLRGFSSRRFQDRNALLGNFEYRWRIFDVLQTALFVDAGYVFPDFEALDFGEPEVGYGIGFRFRAGQNVPLRIDLARSREENIRVYVRLHSFL